MTTRFAQILSYLFHPMIYPMLGVWAVLAADPGYVSSQAIWFTVALVFTGTYVFPLLISFVLYKMGFIKSLEMHSRTERRLPYLVGAICYYLTSLFLRQLPLPEGAFLYIMAAALIILVHLVSFTYLKPSAHMASIGGFTVLLVLLSLKWQLPLLLYISMSIIVAGFVGAARLYLNAHTAKEVVLGYLSGVAIVGIVLLAV